MLLGQDYRDGGGVTTITITTVTTTIPSFIFMVSTLMN